MKYLILLLAISTGALADVSIYRGLATTNLFMDNSLLNNDNEVLIVKSGSLLAGTMTNTYNQDGYFLGWQPRVYDAGRFELYAGMTIVKGYKRWQVPTLKRLTRENRYDSVTVVTPIASASYELFGGLHAQVNCMSGIVWNGGVRWDVKF